MTFEQLRTFLWVARLGGFRKASERLHLSQPAVSTRISNLEDELQAKLFERGPGDLVLTKQGQQLLGYAEQMLFVEEEIKNRVANPAETEGLFRLGASETIAQAWLPRFIEAFSTQFPRVNVDLTVDISLNLRAAILERRLDLAFLMGPISEYSVKNLALPQFDLHWYKSKQIKDVDLAEIPIISYSSKTRPYRELTSELSRRVGPKSRVFSSASLSASLKMIASGIAVGPYPRVLAARHLEANEVEEFDPGFVPPPLEFTASYLAEPRSFLVENSAEIARDVAVNWHNAHPS
ncbi:HTH-type transcriptional regulator YofA [Pelagimonas phthalicica]|uniref:HTH-type transcriptional regulator YofA n=1 Tax=Pelagimonas phthalicica TaxID=1037362 RepID=A0A238JAI8_9RHOB|nr:LysR family transcriptional regulator [Pelagimonas phthalicica]TDS93756.1 LysR family transcriptional regulator [Pelagimonas phthalicica]SMX27720.1 HTH-type transcriptional regulator YofA [Pelagimonas phthalicica]